jgi:hypothetical protein
MMIPVLDPAFSFRAAPAAHLLRVATLAFAIAAAALAAPPARAGVPLSTEDADVLEPGDCELEAQHVRSRGGERRAARATQLTVGCGLVERAQLALGVARESSSPDGERSTALDLGAKLALWDDGADRALALTAGLGWARADGRQVFQGHSIGLAASAGVAPALTLHAHLAHEADRPAASRSTVWALALEHDGVAVGGIRLAPMAELLGDDHGGRAWSLAARAELMAERLWVGLAWGREHGSDTPRRAALSFTLAF